MWSSFNKTGNERSGLENTAWSAGIGVASWLVDKFTPNQAKRIQDRAFERMEKNVIDLERQKRGAFTPEERQDIEDATEPWVNRVAEGVGARGLSTSGAGQQTIADAQTKPFFDAMGNARASFNQANMTLWQASTQMAASDPSFSSLMQEWAAEYLYLRNEGINDPTMQMLAEMMRESNEMYAELTELIKSGQAGADEAAIESPAVSAPGSGWYTGLDATSEQGAARPTGREANVEGPNIAPTPQTEIPSVSPDTQSAPGAPNTGILPTPDLKDITKQESPRAFGDRIRSSADKVAQTSDTPALVKFLSNAVFASAPKMDKRTKNEVKIALESEEFNFGKGWTLDSLFEQFQDLTSSESIMESEGGWAVWQRKVHFSKAILDQQIKKLAEIDEGDRDEQWLDAWYGFARERSRLNIMESEYEVRRYRSRSDVDDSTHAKYMKAVVKYREHFHLLGKYHNRMKNYYKHMDNYWRELEGGLEEDGGDSVLSPRT